MRRFRGECGSPRDLLLRRGANLQALHRKAVSSRNGAREREGNLGGGSRPRRLPVLRGGGIPEVQPLLNSASAAALVAPFVESSASRRAISACSWPMRSVSSPADSRDRSSPTVWTLGFFTGSSSKIAIKLL